MNLKTNKKAIILSVIAVLALVSLVIGGTYAYFQAQGGEDASANVNVATNTTDLLQFKIDKGISIQATQENFSQGKGSLSDTSTASALLRANNKTNSATGRYNIYFVIETNDFIHTSKDNTAELLLNVTDPTGKKVENITGLINTGAGFDITTRTGGFLIVADYDITSNSSVQATEQNWKVEVTFANLDSDQSANAGKSLSGKIYVTKEQLSTYELAQISKMTTTTTYDSISAIVEVTPGTAEVKNYYFASEEVTTPTAYKTNNIKLLANIDSKLTYVESTTPNYKFTNLKDNTTYKIYSYAEDANGIKSNIYETEIKTDAYVIPKVNSVSYTSTLNSISLTVSASKGSNDIVSYRYSKDNGITYEESTSNTYTFNNLNDTTEYKIKVKVKDSLGRYSTEYYEAISTTTYILPVVTNVKTTTTYNSVTLNVTGTNGTNTIAKYKYSINNGPYQESTNATYTFNGLNEKTNYTIKVVAVDTKNRESVVYTTNVTTDAYKLPTVNNVTLSSTANSITINVSGTNGDGTITEYYYSKDDGSTYIKSSSTSHTFSGLTGNTTFYVKVYVKDSNGKQSNVWSGSIATKQSILLANYIKGKYTSQGAGGLYLHDASLANGAGDNSYRYAGPNPNNYVCFGSDAVPCPEDNLYRIIGVFGDQVKLIKSTEAPSSLLGTDGTYGGGNKYYWNNSTNNNKWNESNLNKINLNTNYINKLGTIWTNKIATTTWKVGGNTTANIRDQVPSVAYKNEIVTPAASTTYNAKIGLMYASDYGFAADPSAWTTTLYNYDGIDISTKSWIFTGITEWTISRRSNDTTSVFSVRKAGNVYYDYVSDSKSGFLNIRPVFYINQWELYAGGDGTEEKPIRMKSPDNLIPFTTSYRDGTYAEQHYAISGMTWEQFISSEYNTKGWVIRNGLVCSSDFDSSDVLAENLNSVIKTNNYVWQSHTGGVID